MNGFKTLIGILVSVVLVPKMAKLGLPSLTPDEQIEVVAAIMGGIAVAFRAMTTTPIFSSLRAWLANQKSASNGSTVTAVSPEVLQAIALTTVQELKKSQEKTP